MCNILAVHQGKIISRILKILHLMTQDVRSIIKTRSTLENDDDAMGNAERCSEKPPKPIILSDTFKPCTYMKGLKVMGVILVSVYVK